MIKILLSEKAREHLSMVYKTPIDGIILNDDNDSILGELSEFISQMINRRQWTEKTQPYTYFEKEKVLVIGASENDIEPTIVKAGA